MLDSISNYLDAYAEINARNEERSDFNFAKQLWRLQQGNHALQRTFNDDEVAVAINEIKAEMARCAEEFGRLNAAEKAKVNRHFAGAFISALKKERDTLDSQAKRLVPDDEYKQLSHDWMGKRLTIDVPFFPELVKPGEVVAKNIGPELIDVHFMWASDYCHYRDWNQLLKEHYDNFNLLTRPPAHNYMYSEPRIDGGIFPNPAEYRRPDMLLPLRKTPDKALDLVANPTMYLLNKELEKQKWAKEIPPQVKMIVNLLNIKHGLKLNYPVPEIMNRILSLEFIESMMQQHLNRQRNARSALTVPRDPGILFL